MENFNGAVMVDNEKIRSALQWNKICHNYNNKRLRELKRIAANHTKSMGKFKRWWYKSEAYEDLDFGIFVNKYVHMFDGFEDGYFKAGLICRSEYRILNHHSYSRGDIYHDLLAMIDCGKPVWLSPEQAKFVNAWTFNLTN